MKFNILSVVRKIMGVLERVSPALAIWWATRLFASPRTTQRLVPDIPGLELGWCEFIKSNGRASKARVYYAGAGPAVLLTHGWEGAAYSHSVLARHLVSEGYRVILLDMPAHGMSPGKITNIAEVNALIQTLAAEEGGLHALIGHSFGGACGGFAVHHGLSVNHLITVASPTTIGFMVDRFSKMVGASEHTKQGLIDGVEKILDSPYEHASLMHVAPSFTLKGAIIHDHNDLTVPYQQAVELSKVWPTARFISTKGLGHSRILQDSDVLDSIVEQIRLEPGAEPGPSAIPNVVAQ